MERTRWFKDKFFIKYGPAALRTATATALATCTVFMTSWIT